jgi:hypothetical protein
MSLHLPHDNDPYYEPRDRQEGSLFVTELWWRDRHDEIAEHGYKLRPRYHPQWQPSWLKSGKAFYAVEDGQTTIVRVAVFAFSSSIQSRRQWRAVMDATRMLDNRPVMLKKVLTEEGPYELMISQLFSSPELAGAPHNHCVPLLDVIELQHPEPQKLMVTPFLRPFNQPQMQTFGEFVAFFSQICEVWPSFTRFCFHYSNIRPLV